MILPIYTFGAEVLRQQTRDLGEDSTSLQELIDNMFDTMHNASGVGLAAPQVGRDERVFVVDLKTSLEDDDEVDTTKLPGPLVFINPSITPLDGPEVEYEEGCLSIPEIREDVIRPESIEVEYLDRSFTPSRLRASGLLARVIQHELDHLDGVLFVDRLSPLKRRLLKRRLREMAKGDVTADYPILTAPEVGKRR